MHKFEKTYLKLLRDQVDVEIKFLTRAGHNKADITEPCIWCREFNGRFICNRLLELRQFHSQIVVRLNNKPTFEENDAKFTVLSENALPLLPEPVNAI